MINYKGHILLSLIGAVVLVCGCDVVKSDSDDFRTVQLEANKFKDSNFALNMTQLFPGHEFEESTGLSSFSLTEGEGDRYFIYNDNVESFGMVLAKGDEKMIAQVSQKFIDASSCSATDNFTSATISNDEAISIDLLQENIDLCGANDYDIDWISITTPEGDGNYDYYNVSGYTGSEPGEAYMILEFDPLDDFTGTVEITYLVSLAARDNLGNLGGAGLSWSSTHDVIITVTD